MKKLVLILLIVTLLPPLFAQGADTETSDKFGGGGQPEKSGNFTGFAREYVEVGSDMRTGLDNSLIRIGDFFQRDIVIDMNKISSSIRDGGFNINADGNGNILYVDIINRAIKEGVWSFGFFINAEGKINLNVPKSLFTLITQGNIDQHSFEGMISASGGVYADAGLSASAKYGKLRIGLRPSLFTPLIFIPRSGISYRLETEDAVDLTTSGEINIYYPLDENGNFTGLKFGFDVTLDGEYALLPILDIGGAISRIPFAPATLQNRMKLGMSEINYHLDGEKIMKGGMDDMPNIGKFEDPVFDTAPHKVFRPFRFDAYARYKPFSTEILVVRPNIGFSVDINDKKGYFNTGLEIQSTLARDIIRLHLGTGYEETIWKHRLGFAVNLRAFELGLEAALRADSFPGSFRAQGFGARLSTRFGW